MMEGEVVEVGLFSIDSFSGVMDPVEQVVDRVGTLVQKGSQDCLIVSTNGNFGIEDSVQCGE